MYYTDEMKRAFRAIPCPVKGFRMDVIDNDHFLTLKLHLKPLLAMSGEDQKRCIVYTINVKEALEQAGAVVLVVRDAEDA